MAEGEIIFDQITYVEGVFLILASSKDVFLNRLRMLEEATMFSTRGFESYEEDEDGGIWKVITEGNYTSLENLKSDIAKMQKRTWFLFESSDLICSGKYLYSDGRWITL